MTEPGPTETQDLIQLRADGAELVLSRRGAEPLHWTVQGRNRLWDGEPPVWDRRAPLLFPVVGASVAGSVQVGSETYPMRQHGFARDLPFEVLSRSANSARLRLTDSPETRRHFPFAFSLTVEVTLGPASVEIRYSVRNEGREPMPYALGFHPGFPWPLDASGQEGHRILFEAEERVDVPRVLPETGLLDRERRPISLEGRSLALSQDLFSRGALVLLEAKSRRLRFVSPSGAEIAMKADGFRHWAIWTKPGAPFLCMECLTGHADWVDGTGDLWTRPSMTVLLPGGEEHHAVTLSSGE